MRPRPTDEVGRPDPETIALVRESCGAITDRPELISERFYFHLFELAPSVRPMFAADLTPQHERMTRALLDAVREADDPDTVERRLQQMGARHGLYHGAAAEHYPFVGRALVRAVRDVAPAWSPMTGSAWVQVYEWMAAHMVLGAERGAELVAENPALLTGRHGGTG